MEAGQSAGSATLPQLGKALQKPPQQQPVQERVQLAAARAAAQRSFSVALVREEEERPREQP